jgi:hypothetical protein
MNHSRSLLEAYRKRPYRNIFIALVVVILVDALVPNSVTRGKFSDLVVAGVMVAALVETVRSRHNAVWAALLGLPALLMRVGSIFIADSPRINAATLFLSAVFFAFLIWNMLHDLYIGKRSSSERIFGALCAYVLIGILFALVYTHLEYREPGSFAVNNVAMVDRVTEESTLYPVFTYFSFVTMTTLGYGDITPVTEHARTLAWFEALLGQLYLAVMVAGLVALHISESMNRPE